MDNLNIYLSDGTFNSPIVEMSSPCSKFKAYKVRKEELFQYSDELNNPGLYFLVIGSSKIYVGQSNKVGDRIFDPHTGDIDSSWFAVFAFISENLNISNNELLFLENALCEYIHNSCFICLTTSPQLSNCNERFRRKKYRLTAAQIRACNSFLDDIKFYFSVLKEYLFVNENNNNALSEPVPYFSSIHFYCNGPRGAKAEGVFTRPGFKVLKDSTIANDVSPSFLRDNYYSHRARLIEEGKICNNKFVDDYKFNSPSEAAAVVLGRSAAGTTEWKTADGRKLKDIIG